MRIYEGSPRQDFEEVFRSMGAFIDQRGMKDVLLVEAPDGYIVQGLVTSAGHGGTWSEAVGSQVKETLTFLDGAIAYADLPNIYRQLVDAASRTKIDQDLAKQRTERKIVIKQPVVTKRRYDSSDPTAQYSRQMASAKAARTRASNESRLKYSRICNEVDDSLRSGRIDSVDRDAIALLAKSAYETKRDEIEAKFMASAAAAQARFDHSSGTGQGNALGQTA